MTILDIAIRLGILHLVAFITCGCDSEYTTLSRNMPTDIIGCAVDAPEPSELSEEGAFQLMIPKDDARAIYNALQNSERNPLTLSPAWEPTITLKFQTVQDEELTVKADLRLHFWRFNTIESKEYPFPESARRRIMELAKQD